MGVLCSKRAAQRRASTTAEEPSQNKGLALKVKVEGPASRSPAIGNVNAKPPLRGFSEAEVHAMIMQEGRDIMVIHGRVYDVTTFTASHPGGAAAIKANVGKEVSQTFESIHGGGAHKVLEEFLLGTLWAVPSLLTEEEVQRRIDEEKRALLRIHDIIYDVTDFVASHPGGEAAIMSRVGKEVGDIFARIHSRTAKELAKRFIVGRLVSTTAEAADSAPKAKAGTVSVTLKEALVLESTEVAVGIKNITFSCSGNLQLLPGGHISVLVPDASGKGFFGARHYTPFVCGETSFTITVRKYPHGVVSVYLHSLKPGDIVKYEGPSRPNWVVEEDAALLRVPKKRRHVLFIAGGVGVTPIYTMVRHLLQDGVASVTLVVSYQTPEVMLLRKEIAAFLETYGVDPERGSKEGDTVKESPHKTFELYYVFTRTKEMPSLPETVNVYLGRLGTEVLQKLSPTVSCVICGPPSFVGDIIRGLVSNNVCTPQQVHVL
ncbi:nitrate reductase [Trypanosoma rangeli]|uniref:Nitrate reductase n=1 Tax=Trypanosoma rangeli TaxID=5698 RepID=A0A422NIH2_TRYRA|nr:nitrate reductase [Trypanosoma rangeli]RNF05257.1 nitrate reductase [Trypanosoma rangeli]|eukprot:RNF05257.1 nitrate reductase [Trypanosoma rangeli]